MMKKVLPLSTLVLVFLLGACSSGNYLDGVYTEKASGNGGKMTVQVTIQKGKIKEIAVLENNETPGMLASVEGTLLPRIIDKQGTQDVDTVSGASNTSKAVLKAVSSILEEHSK